MHQLLQQLRQDYPDLVFEVGIAPCWSPQASKVFYREPTDEKEVWTLLHEVAHACLQHTTYTSDVDLVQKEAAAWDKAHDLAKQYRVIIDPEHIQDCLDTYRDWLFKRSTCPSCRAKGIQRNAKIYICINCKATWRVTHARFCRPYRRHLRANSHLPVVNTA